MIDFAVGEGLVPSFFAQCSPLREEYENGCRGIEAQPPAYAQPVSCRGGQWYSCGSDRKMSIGRGFGGENIGIVSKNKRFPPEKDVFP